MGSHQIRYFCISFFFVGVFSTNAYLYGSEIKPNILVFLMDDMGYGDVGVYGHPTINTPYLDKMSVEGQKWTQFYSAASVCTPSRAALLTGRLPVRSGMASSVNRVLFPNSKYGIPKSEILISEKLKDQHHDQDG